MEALVVAELAVVSAVLCPQVAVRSEHLAGTGEEVGWVWWKIACARVAILYVHLKETDEFGLLAKKKAPKALYTPVFLYLIVSKKDPMFGSLSNYLATLAVCSCM